MLKNAKINYVEIGRNGLKNAAKKYKDLFRDFFNMIIDLYAV